MRKKIILEKRESKEEKRERKNNISKNMLNFIKNCLF